MISDLPGRITTYPHGNMIINEKQKWILSARKNEEYVNKKMLLLENGHALGIVSFEPVGFMPVSELISEDLFRKHKYSPEEIRVWWDDYDELWVEEVRVVRKFDRPPPVNVPVEAQLWVTSKNIEIIDFFKRRDWLEEWKLSWDRGKWDEALVWEVLAVDDFDLPELDINEISDAFLYVLLTQGNPDLDEISLGKRSGAIHTILGFQDWKEIETESLELAYEILSLMEDEEYRNIAVKKVVEELNDRGIDAKPEFEKIVFSYLPVLSEKTRKLTANKGALGLFKEGAILYKNAIMAVGSVVDSGAGHDLDILIRKEVPKELANRIAFRIGRACAERKDIQFHIIHGDGPVTSHIPLYDIALIPVPQEKIEMQRTVNTYLFTPMEPMKPIRAGKESSIEASLDYIEEQGIHGYVQAKADGIHAFINIGPDKRMAFSDDGNDITNTLKPLLDLFPKGDYVLDCEVETWIDGEHQPREHTAGNVKAGRSENLSIVAFDCFHHNGQDLRPLPFYMRLKHLEEVCRGFEKTNNEPKKKLGLLLSVEVKTKKELKDAVENVIKNKDVEGFIWKSHEGPYIPNRNRGFQVKWHRNTKLDGIVLDRIETRVSGVFNYEWGILIGDVPAKHVKIIDGENYLVIGKTFSSKKVYNVGDPITVEAETVNIILDEGSVDLTAWAPKVIEEA